MKLAMDFFVPFLYRLFEEKGSYEDSSTIASVLTRLIAHLLHTAPIFPVKEIKSSWGSTSLEPDIDATMRLIKLFVDTGNTDACTALFTRMRAAPRSGGFILPTYSGLVTRLDEYMTSGLQDSMLFRDFFCDAVESLLENITINVDIMAKVILAIKRAGGVSFVKDM
jgi:hypothetical protein